MKRSTSWMAVLPSLVIPVCFGLMMYLGMSALIEKDVIANETLLRYLTGHPVSKVTVAMFFVGLASLVMIAQNVFEQFGAEKKICLDRPMASDEESDQDSTTSEQDSPFEDDEGDQELRSAADEDSKSVASARPSVEKAIACGQTMLELPRWMHEHYLWKRIVKALHSIYRTGSTVNVEDELKYLGDMDLDRQQQRYSLVRILIWATPMLGFLGTVLGISQALGGINVGPENDFQQMMDGLRGSLYVAFDTTALALTLSMVMMFGQFLVDRFESQLLVLVDQRASSEIARHFDLAADATPPMEKVSNDILESMRLAVESQTEVWRKTIYAAEQAWASSLSQVSDQVQDSLSVALDASVSDLAHYLGQAIDRADDSMTQRWGQWQVTLSDNARLLASQQMRMVDQTEIIQKLLVQTESTSLFEPAIGKSHDAIEQTKRLRKSLDELSKVVERMANGDDAGPAIDLIAELGLGTESTIASSAKLPTIIFPKPTHDKVAATHEMDNTIVRSENISQKDVAAVKSFDVPEIAMMGASEEIPFAPLNNDKPEVHFGLPEVSLPSQSTSRRVTSTTGVNKSTMVDRESSELLQGEVVQKAENRSADVPLVVFMGSKKVA